MMDIEKEDRDSTESGVKRHLNLENKKLTEEESSDIGDGATLPVIMDGQKTLDEDTSDDDMMDRSKRTKKAGASSPSLGSAGSREESVRSQ
jgi:hypothetical protein